VSATAGSTTVTNSRTGQSDTVGYAHAGGTSSRPTMETRRNSGSGREQQTSGGWKGAGCGLQFIFGSAAIVSETR
jgi:hypothetical protein